MYLYDAKFSEMYTACEKVSQNGYYRHNYYLFKEKILCVPKCSIRDLLVRKTHEGGLMGCFGIQKTLEALHEHFYWPRMKLDVHKFCDHCIVYKKAKSKVMPHGLYTLLPIPDYSWIDISMDFILDCPEQKMAKIMFLLLLADFQK